MNGEARVERECGGTMMATNSPTETRSLDRQLDQEFEGDMEKFFSRLYSP